MALDPRYVIAPSLEQYYVDKDTGLPLANGVVTFYKDQARTKLKPIYTISGSPPNYTYIQLPNPVNLSAVGTIQDANGNNVIPYYFPYDKKGNVELYYITVYSEGNVLQFTREGWPNYMVPPAGEDNSSLVNYVPNGQFLLHNNISATSTTLTGQVTQPTTIIAQGGWLFNRPEGSTATDFVLFHRYNTPTLNPTAKPRYAVRISTTVTGTSDLFKDLRLKFKDVNKFANTTQTFSFTAQTNTSTNLSLTILLIKNYGTGGSPEDSTVINTVMIQNSPSIINQVINFSDNLGKSIGPNDDDYLQIVIRLPLSFIFDATFTDFILSPGNIKFTEFPQTTNAQFIYRTSGYMPPPNAGGYDLYLPRIKTLEGEQYDDSQIGQCVLHIRKDPRPGELRCDGSSYLYTGYSSDGIPYKRLGDVLLENGTYPKFGTGINFVSAKLITNDVLVLTTNTPGSATEASAGISGFTVTTRVTGNNYHVTGFNLGSDTVYIKQNIKGPVTLANANTAAPYLTISNLRNDFGSNENTYDPGSFTSFALYSIKVISADNAIAGTYFSFSTTTVDYYVWFTIDGKGNDPAPKKLTGIKIDFNAAMNMNDRANFIAEALGGHQITTIITTPASTIKPGNYFTFSVNSTLIKQNYYVWAKIKGIGTDPLLNGIGIPYDLTGSETAKEVANIIILAINKFYVTVPDLRGQFIRIWDQGAGNDPDSHLRAFPYGQGQINSNVIGSLQSDEIMSHSHTNPGGDLGSFQYYTLIGARLGFNVALLNSKFAGGPESRPINAYLNIFIKY